VKDNRKEGRNFAVYKELLEKNIFLNYLELKAGIS